MSDEVRDLLRRMYEVILVYGKEWRDAELFTAGDSFEKELREMGVIA